MDPYYKSMRKKIGHDLLILPAVAACIFQSQKILLVKKRDSKIWALPGGAVEPYETAVEAIKREIREELNNEITITKLLGIYTSPKYDFTYPNGDNVHPFILSFLCVLDNNSKFIPNNEISAFAYFSKDELPANIMTCCKDKALDAFKGGSELFYK